MVFGYRDPEKMALLARRLKDRIRIADAKSAYVPLPNRRFDPDVLGEFIKSLLRPE